jgi:hypothetical protein
MGVPPFFPCGVFALIDHVNECEYNFGGLEEWD